MEMRKMRLNILFSLLYILFFITSCNQERSKIQTEKDFISIVDRDTSRLHLVLYKDRFHGKIINTKPGGYIVKGEINGKIVGDTLEGDNLYTPFKWANQKRAPIVLLKKGENYLLGNGILSIHLGIPHFMPGSINFDNPKHTYLPVQK
ncbi:hypothetical protein [Sphingobacterium sp. CZ-2]|uniref:hypothetical protein n=1 Tax=Sphingobacterium sp. CZ-2 TaxID=2557994 RepID=UPI00142FEA41|nr:hypothetical protein [Sphingobacterium sp. CZ-2]